MSFRVATAERAFQTFESHVSWVGKIHWFSQIVKRNGKDKIVAWHLRGEMDAVYGAEKSINNSF
jgi:hypothetical protein